ncbi:AarF/ABC1/UbiB kinase family protein [Candidatus Binatia bacterium]|nr:AarF/ABC1/UbiB kinase family protein [Candidatus Binatia bacterium]
MRHHPAYRAIRTFRVVAPALLRYRRLEARQARGLSDTVAWERAHDRFARGIAGLGDDLGGAFVKLCQVAGARADVLPAAFIRELGRFHDRVLPRPWSALSATVEQELGRPVNKVFVRVDPQPLAAASLAQVHRAWLHSGESVALKIQYPEAMRLYHADLALVRRAVAAATRLFADVPLAGLVEEVAHFIGLELDFAREAESTERVRMAFDGDATVRVPRLHRELCSARLLVLEFLEGTPIHATERLAADGTDLSALADRIADLYRRMLFEHGFFHGDPHPGNLLVLPDGSIGLLDFGLAKELPPGFAENAAAMFARAVRGDRAGAVEAARGLGFRFERDDPDAFSRMLEIALGARHDFGEMRKTLSETDFERVPPDVALVFRTLILLNGLSERLVPGERRIPSMLVAGLVASASTGRQPEYATA